MPRYFRLLSEFSHFLFTQATAAVINACIQFPSPLGVLSFLIIIMYDYLMFLLALFPSPLGVLSFLINSDDIIYDMFAYMKVSVSSRSSLISYMFVLLFLLIFTIIKSFRLLSEFSHFLFSLCYDSIDKKFITHEFPSPLGVHLFLIDNIMSINLQGMSSISVSSRSSLISYIC